MASDESSLAFYILPVPTKDLASIIAPKKLLPVPTSDKSIFPNGFPANTHPVLALQGFGNDIRMQAAGLPLFIQSLLTATVLLPYVDQLGDGKTPFTYQVGNFLGGVNGQDINTLVPVLVGALEGNPLHVATFGKLLLCGRSCHKNTWILIQNRAADPNDKAYDIFSGGIYSATGKEVIVPNPVSGPGVYPDLIDTLFSTPSKAGSTAKPFHQMLNFPIILPTGQCQRNTYYFNETFANPQLGRGNVTLYSPALPASLTGGGSAGSKQYDGVAAYAAVAEMVGYNPEDCATASKNVDPKALK